ncbi:MAG: c-type cytochrome [Sphingomicrobium sp.]
MVGKAVYALCAIVVVAGCGAQDQSNQVDSTNSLMPSAETRTGASEALALMKERHEHMETLGDETKRISNQLKSATPEIEQIRRSAAIIAQRAPDLVSWFPAGTGPDIGKTRAKAEIWQTPDDYATKANDFVRAAEDFDSAAKSGDLGQIESSFAALGKTCKACHDRYRAPEKD